MRTRTSISLLTMALLVGCGAPRAERGDDLARGGGGGEHAEGRCGDLVLDPDAPDGTAALWNQKEVDEALHLVAQERTTDLSLTIRSARPVERPEATVVRTDWRSAQPVALSDEGSFAVEELGYSGSGIDVVLANDHFAPAAPAAGVSGVRRSLIARWYHPGAWFDAVAFELDVTALGAEPFVTEEGLVAVRLTYPQGATVSAALAGVGDDADTVEVAAAPGGGVVTYPAGSEGDLSLVVTLSPGAGVITTQDGAGQDPPMVSRTYKRCFDHRGGDPYGHVPDTTPSQEIELLLTFDFAG